MRVLLLQLEAPLMAFGREAIDQNGPTRDHPDASMLTGLFANALGYRREEAERHQRLQDRLRFATRLDRQGHDLYDNQNALLFEDEKGWTTHGTPEGREKSPSYRPDSSGRRALTHRRFRHYRADASICTALALAPAEEAPTVDEIAAALGEPARPLFIGRKPCLPAASMAIGVVEAGSLLAALASVSPAEEADSHQFILAPENAEGLPRAETRYLTGRRDWVAGVHAGQERRIAVSLPHRKEATP